MIFNIDKKDGNILGSIGTLGKGAIDYIKIIKQQKELNKNQIQDMYDSYSESMEYNKSTPADFMLSTEIIDNVEDTADYIHGEFSRAFDIGDTVQTNFEDGFEIIGKLTEAFEGDYEAKNAITTIFGDADNVRERLAPIWDEIENGAMTVDGVVDYLKDDIDNGMSEIGDAIKGASEDVVDSMHDIEDNVPDDLLDDGIQNSVNSAKKILSNGVKKLGQIAKGIGSALLDAGLIWLITKGVEVGFNLLDEYLHHAEHVIERGKEAQEELDKMQDGIQETDNQVREVGIKLNIEDIDKMSVDNAIDEIANEYAKLKAGVDINTNNNISLSSDEYEKYLETSNMLAKVFPELIKGYDAQSNAILSIDTNSKKASKSIKELYKDSKNYVDLDMQKKLPTAMEGIVTQIEQLKNDAEQLKGSIGVINMFTNALSDMNDVDLKDFGFTEGGNLSFFIPEIDSENINELRDEIYSVYQEAAEKAGLSSTSNMVDTLVGEESGYKINFSIPQSADMGLVSPEQLEEFEEYFKQGMEQFKLEDLPEEFKNLIVARQKDLREIKATWNSFVPYLINSMNLYDDFVELGNTEIGQQLQDVISQQISNVDISKLDKEGKLDSLVSDPRGFLADMFLEPIIEALKDGKSEIQEDMLNEFQDVLTLDTSKLTNEELRETLDTMLKNIFGDNEEAIVNIKVALGYEFDDETGHHETATSIRDRIFEYFGGEVTGQGKNGHQKEGIISWEDIKSLVQKDQTTIIEAIDNGDKRLEDIDNFDKLIEFIKRYRTEIANLPKEGLLSDVLGDAVYSDRATKFESNISSIESALASLRDNGKLTSDEMKKLQDTFTGMTDFSYDNIAKQGVSELADWIKLLKEQADAIGMSSKGMEELETYINNLVGSYSDLSISSKDAMDMVRDSVIGDVNLPDNIRRQKYNNIESTLQEIYGDELDARVIVRMILKDEFSGEIDEILEHYNDEKVYLDIIVRREELQNEIDKISAELSGMENTLNLTVEDNGFGTEEQYEGLINKNSEYISSLLEARQEQQNLIDGWEGNKNTPAFTSAITQLNEYDAQIAEATKKTEEWKLMLNGGIELAGLQNQFKDLENEASNLSNEISDFESHSIAIPKNIYQSQINNTREQISNLNAQNEALREQQASVGDNITKYRELEDTIRSNNSSIASLTQQLNTYQDSVRNYAVNSATQMSEAIASALSESQSGTGLTQTTMNTLIGQFKQLESISHIDLSSMFIKTAKGIQVNVSAIRKLVNAQSSLVRSNLAKQINIQNKELQRQVRAYKNTSVAANQDGRVKRNAAKQNLKGVQAEIKALEMQANAYYAMQKYMEDQTSRYQALKTAKETPNPGDQYKEFFGYTEDMVRAAQIGEVGTDDWKKYWEFISEEKRHSMDYAESQFELLKSYLTEDRSGIEHFMDDLVRNGFATNFGGQYVIDLQDTEAMKQSYGWSDEMLKMLFERAKDFGANVSYVTSYADGMLQLDDAINDVIDSMEHLTEYDNHPFWSQEGLEEARVDYGQAWLNFENIRDQLALIGDDAFSEEQYNTAVGNVNRLAEALREINPDANEASRRMYNSLLDEILSISDEFHLDLDTQTFEVRADTNSYEQSLERVQQMQDYTFESGKEKLQELINTWNSAIDLDFNFEEAPLDLAKKKLEELKDFSLQTPGLYEDPQALEALNQIVGDAQKQVDFRVVLDTVGMDKEQFLALTDEDKMEKIQMAIEMGNIDSSAQEILNYANGLDVPMKVEFDMSSVQTILDAIAEMFGKEKVQIEPNISENTYKDIQEQIENLGPFTINVDADMSSISDTLLTDPENTDKINELVQRYISDYKSSGLTPEQAQIQIDESTFKEARDAWSGIIDPAKFEPYREQFQQMADEAGTDIETVIQSLNNAHEILTNSLSETIQNVSEVPVEPVQVKFEELGDTVDKTSEKVDNLKEKLNTVTGGAGNDTIKVNNTDGGSGNDTISATSEPESSSLLVMKVTFNEEQTQESIQEVLTQVQTYADEHDVKVEINGEDLTTEKVEEITSKVEEGNTITLTIAGQEDEQNKASAMISKLFEYNGQQVAIFVKADPDGEVFQLDQTLVSMTEEGKYTISIPVRRDKEDTDLEEYLNELVNWAQEHGDINIAVNGTDITTANTDITTLKETIGNSEEFVVDITAPQDKLQEAIDKINEVIQMAGQGGSLNIDTNTAKGKVDDLRNDIQNNPANLSINTDPMKVRNDIQETLNANPVTVTVQGNYVQPVIPGAMPAITGAHGTLSAYAQGTGTDVAVSKDQDALVNEVNYKGQQSEGLIRKGVLTELSPGMHVEHLQKGDVILNARQMFELKKKGKANGSAKLVGGDSALALGTVRKDFSDEEFPALALGTVYNGMPSYASVVGSWAPSATHPERSFGSVEPLGDFEDAVNDAGDSLGDAGDSAGDLGDALDSATEQVEHSSQVIDLIERRLKYFADRTKKIADQMQEYMSASTKRNLISDQISAVLDEIYANSRATTAYREEADKTARDFKYYGQDEGYVQYIQEQTDAWKAQMAGLDRNSEEYKSMQPQLDALNNQLNELKNQKNEYHIDLASEIDLDALRRGDYRFEEIDTSTQHGQALYDAAQEYMSKYDKSISADQNIDALSDQLRDLFSQMIQLPFDELSKSLNKLEKTLQTLTGLADASAKGESTVRQLNKILEETFGPEKAKKYFNSVGKPFQAANREIDKALKKQKQQVEANNQAYESSVNTKKDLQRRLKDAKRRKKNANSDLDNTSYAYDPVLTPMFSGDGLVSSADSIADAKKAEVEIREIEDAIKEADEKMKEQLEATKQSAIEYAQALIQSVFDKLDNINNYYKSLSDWQALLGEQLSQNRDYLIKTGSYIKDSKDIIKSYSDEIGIYNQEANILAENISEQKKQLDEAVQNGTIEIDSMEYRQAATEIKNLEIEYTRLRSTQQDLFKEMVNVPAEKYAEAINKIENAYSDLNTVMSKNLAATRSSQIALSRAGQALSNLGISNGFGKYNQSNLSFANQNVQLSEDTKQQQENLQEAARYYRQTQLNYEAIKNTPNIDPGQVKSALEAMEEARKVMDDALANAVNAEIENAYQSVKAVDEYYSSFYNHYKNMSDAIESYREAQEAFGRRMDENGDLITDTTAINESYRKQIEYLSKAQENVNQDIVDTKAAMDNVANTLGTDSERYRELEDHLIGLQNESVGLTVKAEQLGDAWREKLIKPFDESIEKFQTIRNNFAAMNGLISDEMKLTKDGEWTQLGQVSLTLDMGAYTNSLKELEKAEARFNEIEEMHRKNEYESDEEYLKERQESIEKIQSAMSSSFSARQTLLDDMKKRYQQEVNYIKELINVQSKELSKRKEIADYEKNLHKKNLAIQDIESQIRAISGLEDAESKAQRARLEAQKKELTDERDETVQNHIYDLRQEGLQQLSEDLDKSFEKYSENLALNIGEATEAIGGLSDALTGKLTETNASLLGYLRTFNTGLTTEMATGQSQLNADNATQILNQKLLQDSANSMVQYQNNLSAQMNDKIFGENGYPAQQIAEQKAMDALVQKYQGEQKEREDALKAQNEYGGTAFDQRNLIATSIKGDEKSIINVLEGKFGDLESKLGKEGPLYQAVSTQKAIEETKDIPKNANVDTTPIGGNTLAQNSQLETNTNQITTGGTSNHTFDPNNLTANKNITQKKEVDKNRDYAATIIHKAFNDYKKYGFSSAKKMLDHLYKRKTIDKSKLTDAGAKGNVTYWNSNGVKASQETIKELINSEIDKNGSSIKKYASGTLSARSGLSQVFEQGPEIITTPKGTFIPFAGGEGVVPAKETANLMKLAHAMESGKLQLQMPDMSSYKIPEVKQNVTNNSEIHIDSLITINGNADQNTVDQIRQIAQQLISDKRFQENVTQFVSQRQARDARMSGMRSGIK